MNFFIPEDLNNNKSGKHKFLKKLRNALVDCGLGFKKSNPDILLHIGRNYSSFKKRSKLIRRLDGLEFNTKKSYKKQNKKVIQTIRDSDAMLFQNKFCAKAYLNFLTIDARKLSASILNGSYIQDVDKDMRTPYVVANCKWRPHKRLDDIIASFLIAKSRGFPLKLVVTGDIKNRVPHDDIEYTGWISDLKLKNVISKSMFGIHLAWIDWCPNSVVEYMCSNKPVIHTSSGGTKYIVKNNGVSISDVEWNFKPLDLYSPPNIDREEVANAMFYLLKNKINVKNDHIDINNIALEYKSFFEEVLSK